LVSDVTSINTVTPNFSPVEYTSTGVRIITGDTSTLTTVLPVPPVNVEVVPNPDITIVSDIDAIYLSKINEISQLHETALHENVMTNSDLIGLIKSFTIEQISSSNFNEFVLLIINCFNG
jgi:hypothetical protein